MRRSRPGFFRHTLRAIAARLISGLIAARLVASPCPRFRVVTLPALALLAALAVMPHRALAQECEPGTEECDDQEPPVVSIIPSGGSFSNAALAVTIEWCDNHQLSEFSRVITLNGVDVAANFDYTPASLGGCVESAVSQGTITLSPGTNTLYAEISDMNYGPGSNSATYGLVTGRDPPIVSVTPHNGENRDVSLCIAHCFDVVHGYSTPAYVSMDVPRSATLVYRSSQADPRPVVQVDARDDSPTPANKLSIGLKHPNGSWVTLVNGATEVFYQRGAGDSRMAVQFDATSLGTGVYAYTVVVRSWWTDGTVRETTVPIKVPVLNEKNSEFGWGWSLAGVGRIHEQGDGWVVVTEGDGSVRAFLQLPCSGTCNYTSPNGDFTTLTRRASWADNLKWDRRYPDGTTATYQADGRIAYVEDRFGNRTTFAYSGSPSRLASITDPAGQQLTFGYGGDGKLDWIKDPGNRYSYVTVDAALNLTAIQDPGALNPFTATYDARHRPVSRLDRRGGSWGVAYDFAGKHLADTLPTVVVGGQSVRPVITSRSTESSVLVNPASGLGTASNPAPSVLSSALRAEVTNARGFVTKYALDRWGAATIVEEPLARVSRVWRNARGQDTLVISPRGDSSRMTWTGPNLTRVIRRPGGRTINLEYESTYNELTRLYGDLDSTRYYWSFGRLDSTRVAAQGVTKFKYDSRGRDTLRIDPNDHKTRRYYRATGLQNLDSVKVESRRTAFTHDAFGRDSTVTDPANDVVVTQYDAINRVIRRVGPHPFYDTTTYSYDALFLRAVVDAKGQRYAFAPNALGWVVSDTIPLGVARTFAYDVSGNLVSSTNRRAQTLTFAYDSLDHVRTLTTPDAGTRVFVTDPLGRYVAGSNGESVDTIKFDVLGRQIAEISVRGGVRFELMSTYDARDRRTQVQMSGPGGWMPSVGYRYNARSRLDTLIDVGGGRTTMAHDGEGIPNEIRLPNGVTITRGVPSTHSPSRTEYSIPGIDSLIGRRYGYEGRGGISERLNAAADSGREFVYDELGRLVEHRDFHAAACTPIYEYDDPPPGAEPIGWDCSGRVVDRTTTYTYDKVGNRTDLGAITATGNRLVRFNGDSLVYDVDGNLVRRIRSGADVQRLHWNSLGQLIAAWTNGSDSVSFAYDAAGRRTRKWTALETRRYLHDGDDLFAELDGGNAVIAEYTYYPGIDQPHSVRRGGATYFYAREVPGHVTAVLNGSGGIVNRYEYSPFGTLEDSTVALPSENLRFGARELDKETGLYFLRGRYYDASVGRFVSEDPSGIGAGINLYSYAQNDPVNRTDPTGLDWVCTTEVETVETEDGPKELERTVCRNDGGGGVSEANLGGFRLLAGLGRVAAGWLIRHSPRVATALGLTAAFARLSPDLAATFRNGQYVAYRLASDMRVWRLFDNVNAAMTGNWFTTCPIASCAQAKLSLQLLKNDATFLVEAIIPRGTLVYQGIVAGSPTNSVQVYVSGAVNIVRFGAVTPTLP